MPRQRGGSDRGEAPPSMSRRGLRWTEGDAPVLTIVRLGPTPASPGDSDRFRKSDARRPRSSGRIRVFRPIPAPLPKRCDLSSRFRRAAQESTARRWDEFRQAGLTKLAGCCGCDSSGAEPVDSLGSSLWTRKLDRKTARSTLRQLRSVSRNTTRLPPGGRDRIAEWS